MRYGLVAVVPAAVIIGVQGDGSANNLLVMSQIVLGIQLPLAMFPLMMFTSSKAKMGKFKNGWILLTLGWGSTVLITALDLWGLWGVVMG